MYRRTAKYSAARQEAMQRGRAQTRMSKPAPDYPTELPQVRMRITVERFDMAAPERHEFELRRTNRVDVYAVLVDGKPWKQAGLTAVLEGLRKACPRVMSTRRI
jgi:hypothetical protein